MKAKKLGAFLLVFVFIFGMGLCAYAAGPQNPGPNENPGPWEDPMTVVSGCAYVDQIWIYDKDGNYVLVDVWRLGTPEGESEIGCHRNADTDPILDFGPENYCPDPCLDSELITDQLNGTEPVDIKIGSNLIGTFRWSCTGEECIDPIILAATYNYYLDPNPEYEGYHALDWIPLTPAGEYTNYGRPQVGEIVTAFGRGGETDNSVLVWEIRYGSLNNDYQNWYWWRTSGIPWAKMELLNCSAQGEE